MTNLFAVKIEHKKQPYIFCVADSQATGEREKESNVQKLYQRGPNLVMGTGSGFIIPEISRRVVGFNGSAPELCDVVLKASEDLNTRFKGDKRALTTIYIAGKDGQDIKHFAVNVIEYSDERVQLHRTISPIMSSFYFDGSGASHTRPAMIRDFETQSTAHPESPLEALHTCFNVGQKAGTDIGVNERLQFGFVSSEGVRFVLPPGTNTNVPFVDHCLMYSSLVGFPVDINEKNYKQKIIELTPMIETIASFYLMMQRQMARLNYTDLSCNNAHTRYKLGKKGAKKDYNKARKLRAEEAVWTQKLVDAFMKGGLDNIVPAVEALNKRENDYCDEALRIHQKYSQSTQ